MKPQKRNLTQGAIVAPALLVAALVLAACSSGSRSSGVAGADPDARSIDKPGVSATVAAPARETITVYPPAPAGNLTPSPASLPPVLPSLSELLSRMPTGETFENPEPLPPPSGVRIGLLLPLSGPASRIGHAMLSASEMAMFDFAGNSMDITVRDTKGTPAGAADAARLVIGDGAQIIIGPLLSTSVTAIAPQARAAGVPVLTFSTDRRIVGNGVYTIGFLPDAEISRVVSYAAQRGARRIALLAPADDYGNAVSNALERAAFSHGVDIYRTMFYDPFVQDYSAQVRSLADFENRRQALLEQRRYLATLDDDASRARLKKLEGMQTIGDPPFDALLVADGGKRLIAVAALLPFFDIDPGRVQILGTGLWDEQGLASEPALLGGVYAAPDPAKREAFINRYRSVFSVRPPRLTTLAYDAMALAVVLARQPVEDPFAPNMLLQPGGFAGRDGVFRFTASGIVERGLAVLEVKRGKPRVVDPAAISFQ